MHVAICLCLCLQEDLPFWQQQPFTIAAYLLLVAGCVFAPVGVAFLFVN